MQETVLSMMDITKRFPGVLALDKAYLEVKKGEVHVLIGENGAGKSTLIRILSGAHNRDSGRIILADEELGGALTPGQMQKLGISTIYQEISLAKSLTVAENIYLGREPMSDRVPAKISWKKLFRQTKDCWMN
ncbi:MAG: ATP-binding cassette domain-containing protein [Bacillota bacterium]